MANRKDLIVSFLANDLLLVIVAILVTAVDHPGARIDAALSKPVVSGAMAFTNPTAGPIPTISDPIVALQVSPTPVSPSPTAVPPTVVPPSPTLLPPTSTPDNPLGIDRSKPFGETTFHTTVDACKTDLAHKALDAEPWLWYAASYTGIDAHCLALMKVDWDNQYMARNKEHTKSQWSATFTTRANGFAYYVGAPQVFLAACDPGPCFSAHGYAQGNPYAHGDAGVYTESYRSFIADWSNFNDLFGGSYGQ